MTNTRTDYRYMMDAARAGPIVQKRAHDFIKKKYGGIATFQDKYKNESRGIGGYATGGVPRFEDGGEYTGISDPVFDSTNPDIGITPGDHVLTPTVPHPVRIEGVGDVVVPPTGAKDDSRIPVAPIDKYSDFDQFSSAVKTAESNNNPNAVSPKGAKGVNQVMDSTNKDPGYGVTPAQDDSPEERERVGDDYLRAMLDKYGGNKMLAAAAYNAGPGKVGEWLGRYGSPLRGDISDDDFAAKIPYPETKKYVSSVLGNMLQQRDASQDADSAFSQIASSVPSQGTNSGASMGNAMGTGPAQPPAQPSMGNAYQEPKPPVTMPAAQEAQMPPQFVPPMKEQAVGAGQDYGRNSVATVSGLAPVSAPTASGTSPSVPASDQGYEANYPDPKNLEKIPGFKVASNGDVHVAPNTPAAQVATRAAMAGTPADVQQSGIQAVQNGKPGFFDRGSPFWEKLQYIGANIAASGSPFVGQAIGEGMAKGLQQYNQAQVQKSQIQKTQQETQGLRSSNAQTQAMMASGLNDTNPDIRRMSESWFKAMGIPVPGTQNNNIDPAVSYLTNGSAVPASTTAQSVLANAQPPQPGSAVTMGVTIAGGKTVQAMFDPTTGSMSVAGQPALTGAQLINRGQSYLKFAGVNPGWKSYGESLVQQGKDMLDKNFALTANGEKILTPDMARYIAQSEGTKAAATGELDKNRAETMRAQTQTILPIGGQDTYPALQGSPLTNSGTAQPTQANRTAPPQAPITGTAKDLGYTPTVDAGKQITDKTETPQVGNFSENSPMGKLSKTESDALDSNKKDMKPAREAISQLDQIFDLYQKIGGGAYTDWKADAQRYLRGLGVDDKTLTKAFGQDVVSTQEAAKKFFNIAITQLKANTGQREPGFMQQAFMKYGSPNIDMEPEAAIRLAAQLKANANYTIAYGANAENYMQRHGGRLIGYSNFVDQNYGNDLNSAAQKWGEDAISQHNASYPPNTGTNTGAQNPGRNYSQSPQGPIHIQNAADYSKVPKSTQYVDPNGILRTKP